MNKRIPFKCHFCKYAPVCIPELESGLHKIKELEETNVQLQKEIISLQLKVTSVIQKYENGLKEFNKKENKNV